MGLIDKGTCNTQTMLHLEPLAYWKYPIFNGCQSKWWQTIQKYNYNVFLLNLELNQARFAMGFSFSFQLRIAIDLFIVTHVMITKATQKKSCFQNKANVLTFQALPFVSLRTKFISTHVGAVYFFQHFVFRKPAESICSLRN